MYKLFLATAASFVPAAAMAATVTLSALGGGTVGELYSGDDGFYLKAQDTDDVSGDIIYSSLGKGRNAIVAPDDPSAAWNRWHETLDCETDGTGCLRGWAFSVAYFLPDAVIADAEGKVSYSTDFGVFDPTQINLVNYSYGMTPNFFETPELAIGDVAGETLATFNLPESQKVGFFILDDYIADNQGDSDGFSFEVSPVPVPAGFALMGVAVAGLFGLRRKS